jgi:hypothetical protein
VGRLTYLPGRTMHTSPAPIRHLRPIVTLPKISILPPRNWGLGFQ